MKPTGKVLHLDCPECGRMDRCDEDGCCTQCGSDLCWVYGHRREYTDERGYRPLLRRVDWYRIVAERAKEYGPGCVTPALAQACKTKVVTS